MLTKKQKLITLGMSLFPTLLFAQEDAFASKIEVIISYFTDVLAPLVVTLSVIYLIYQFWSGKQDKIKEAIIVLITGAAVKEVLPWVIIYVF
ncbi:hypothetical protein HOH45_08905 [bacterium]|nr:hypothetical protein [bacterium]